MKKKFSITKKIFSGNVIYNIHFYFFLALRKIKISLHNKFEKRIIPNKYVNNDDFNNFLWNHLISGLIEESDKVYYKTNVTNRNSPMLLSQARIILILCSNFAASNIKVDIKNTVTKMTDYLLSMRNSEGLFTFNQVSWDNQDEGIASTWASLALIRSYELTHNKLYLDIAINTFNAMFKYLYSKKNSLVHTKGDNFWCLNAASTFAYACSLLLNHYYDERIVEAMNDSIELCVNKLAEDGHYPYNTLRPGTYLLLYHPIVILTINYCLSSKYVNNIVKEKSLKANQKAINYLKCLINKNNRIFEPEILHYSQYIISNITSLLALKGNIEKDIETEILNNLFKFLKGNKLYLCMSGENKLYDSDLYSVSDVLTIEVLYWYDIYQKK